MVSAAPDGSVLEQQFSLFPTKLDCPSMQSSSGKNLTKSVVLLLALAGLVTTSMVACLMLGIEFWIDRRNTLPSDISTLGQLNEWSRDVSDPISVNVDGERFLVVFGPPPIFPIKEYPAGYLFNEAGELIDWSLESSDVDEHAAYWNAARQVLREPADDSGNS